LMTKQFDQSILIYSRQKLLINQEFHNKTSRDMPVNRNNIFAANKQT
jgi:hypothetical protein